MRFADFHTHICHPGSLELVSAPVRPEGARYWSLELHPWYCRELPPDFERMASTAEALGETGFDRLRGVLPYPEAQCRLFSAVLETAAALHKPVVIHAVGSFDLLFQTIRPWQKKVPLLFHGFARKSPELLRQLIDRGFWVSLSPRMIEEPEIREYCARTPHHIGLESDDSGMEIEELYTRFAVPQMAEQAEQSWKEFWSE